jgi:hypothetical protein
MIPLELIHEICAEAGYEVQRMYCRVNGIEPGELNAVWADAPEWMRDRAVKDVINVLTDKEITTNDMTRYRLFIDTVKGMAIALGLGCAQGFDGGN